MEGGGHSGLLPRLDTGSCPGHALYLGHVPGLRERPLLSSSLDVVIIADSTGMSFRGCHFVFLNVCFVLEPDLSVAGNFCYVNQRLSIRRA